MAKYGMSMCVLGMAKELGEDGIAVNALWPRTGIQTSPLRVQIFLASTVSLYCCPFTLTLPPEVPYNCAVCMTIIMVSSTV